MPSPHTTLIPLREAAPCLPDGHPLAQGLARSDASARPAAWVLSIEGDLELDHLDLGTPLHTHAGLHALWPGHEPSPEPPCLLLVHGTLRIAGALMAPGGDCPTLCVRGSLHCRHALLAASADVEVGGGLYAEGLLWCGNATPTEDAAANEPTAACLTVRGPLQAAVAVFRAGARVQCHGPEHIGLCVDAARHGPRRAALGLEALAQQLLPGLLHPLAPEPADAGALVDGLRLRAALHAGGPVLRPAAAPWPLDAALCTGPGPTLAQLRQLLRAALPDKTRHKAQGWFGQTDFLLTRRHQDEDGDTYHDGLFLTEWKTWDFWFSDVPAPEPRSLLGAAAAAVRRWAAARWRAEVPGLAPGFTQLFRAYGADGRPGPWQPLAGPQADPPPGALRACARAWHGVADYWRKAEGQRRAGHPLRQQLLTALAPARVEALTLLPVFTTRYDDWWDGERNGWWEGDLWVGARQPGTHHGRRWPRALKLGWENGTPAPGDGTDDALASYQIDIERDAGGHATAHLLYAQRQSDAPAPLPAHAVDHMARLLRLFEGIAQRLQEAGAQPEARAAEARRIAAEVQLLTLPPVAAQVPDSAVFPAALMAASDAWQADGRAYVAQVRARLGAIPEDTDAAPEPLPPTPWPDDARRHRADTALQLARVVSRHADADLAARFHRRFAFAPAAFDARAHAGGRPVGPVFWLDGGGLVARVGAAHGGAAAWVHASADGLQWQALDGVRSVGRSPSRTCFAVIESDGHLTTRQGWNGPVLARLALPQRESAGDGAGKGAGDGPEPAGQPTCDGSPVLWPSDDGQSVRVRTRSGALYRTDAAGVHPWLEAADASALHTGDGPPTAIAHGLLVRGDAHGDLLGCDEAGHVLWRHHVGGGAVCGLDVAPDGRTLVAGSQGGYLVVLRKGPGLDPFAVGTSRFGEAWRLIFWQGEDAPIRW